MSMKKNHYLFGCMLGWLLGMLCVGCATEGTEGLPQYDPTSGESYYTWLYRDSAFLECRGNPDRPWEEPVDWRQYYRIHNRMIRHLVLGDTLTWDFTAKEVKVDTQVYDFLIKMWTRSNIRLQSGKFTFQLRKNASYSLIPKEDMSNL